MSILSFPDRGPWGQSSWRGNCSGHVYKSLFEQLRPSVFVDPMVGSGTSVEVAREMGIKAFGLDLHSGFNVLRESILSVVGQPADLVVSHPPYGGMILYSGNVWGSPHADDLSRCIDDQDFHEKLHIALMNQREATKGGGYYGTIIGDWRRNGRYTSYQAECIARMPADELAAVLIKQQHNTVSNSRGYTGMKMPRILHEYILLWEKPKVIASFLSDLSIMARQQSARLASTWKALVRMVLMALGGKADLATIYTKVAENAPERLANNPNWKAKVRQVLNQNSEYFASCQRGIWALTA
ncbi:hypothetical protein [Giesbergeria anulus]|uniref:DNA methylase n=1 Tax=Giesbergeria anulus TaxID=180197 RepID=A0A1H9NG89_9BURK|nr:hypothetical protein [Giesbergeria anulus]SER34881.1 hypothetical protein SAMN02982919_02205 [Giesbergeria anulus]